MLVGTKPFFTVHPSVSKFDAMLVCFDAELRRTGTIPLEAADGKHADLVLAQSLSAALQEARERHTTRFKPGE